MKHQNKCNKCRYTPPKEHDRITAPHKAGLLANRLQKFKCLEQPTSDLFAIKSPSRKQNRQIENSLKEATLQSHEFPVPGKISIVPTESLATSKDLASAYPPGVAAPCIEIHADPQDAYKYTIKGSLVVAISSGAAVLGLGNIGALVGKPVMEGKGVSLKKFAGADVFDIETDEKDP